MKSDDPIACLAQVPLLPPIATIAWWFISGSIRELGKILTFSGLGSLCEEIFGLLFQVLLLEPRHQLGELLSGENIDELRCRDSGLIQIATCIR